MEKGSEQQKATKRIGNLIYNKSQLSARRMVDIEAIWARVKEEIHGEGKLRYGDFSRLSSFVSSYGTREDNEAIVLLGELITK